MTAVARPLELTEQQRAALDANERSLSVSAGAGCGKTFVLTERFLKQVDPRSAAAVADLGQLAAITFTDAAAREMRQRIRNRCYQRLRSASDPGEAAAWQRLMRSIEAARISTIHSFCTELLRRHYVEAGLDPQFQVLDAAAAELLRFEAVDARLQRLLEDGDPRVIDLAVRFRLDGLRRRLLPLACDGTIVEAQRWRGVSPQQLYDIWEEHFRLRVQPEALQTLMVDEAVEQLRSTADPQLAITDKLRAHLLDLQSTLAATSRLAASDALESTTPIASACRQLAGLARVQGVCTKKDWRDESDYHAFREACKNVRDALESSILTRAEGPREASLQAAGVGLKLLELAGEVSEEVRAWKTARNQLEFDDLLLHAHRLLTDPACAAVQRQASSDLRLLMVDEFQDTDPRQVEIVQALSGDAWARQGLFVVGDFKQSIYRFRDAEPRVFHELREQLPPEGRLSLTANFRSQPAILNFVNALFHDAFSMPQEPLAATRPQTSPPPAIEFLWSSDAANDAEQRLATARQRDRGQAHRHRRREAQWIARRLRQLIDSGEPIVAQRDASGESPRALQLGDVAILFRSLSDVDVYENALREYGLDYYLAGGHAFYAQQEIFDVLNLLQAVASEVDEISLVGALRSPFFALKDATLFWLAQTHGTLNAALAADAAPRELDGQERAKFHRAAATLGRLRQMKDQSLVAELLAEALRLTGYDAVVLAEFLGARKLANLKKLVELARSLDRYWPGDLPRFIRQLSEFVARAPKEPLAATQSQGDVIRLMTIHYAKGLEFPLVVLPDLERPRHPGQNEPALHPELGPVLPADGKSRSLGWELYRHLESREELEERTRLLYVACTRAADYLLLSSHLNDPEKPGGDWLQLVARRFELATGALREPLPEGYATPQIRVTTEEPNVRLARDASHRVSLEQVVRAARERIAEGPIASHSRVEPIPPDVSLRRRFSFSRLTGRLGVVAESTSSLVEEDDAFDAEAPPLSTPLNARECDVDPRQFGRLVHAVLERIDLGRPADAAELCERLAPQFCVDHSHDVVTDAAEMVSRFLRSSRGEQLIGAKNVEREVEFILPWKGAVLPANCYLHGFVDCLYQDQQGRWRLLDYKTNNLSAEEVEQNAKQYEPQLYVYAMACQQALQTELEEIGICYLRPGANFAFHWSESDLQRLNGEVTEAIRAAASPDRQGLAARAHWSKQEESSGVERGP